MIERAGLWRRGLAAIADLLVAQVLLQCLVVLLFSMTGGHVTTNVTLYSSCRTASAPPAGVMVPAGFRVTRQNLCTSHFFAPTRVLYVAQHDEKAGAVTTTTTFSAPTSPDGAEATHVLSLDALYYPLFVLLRWATDRFAGGSLGRRLVRIAITNASAATTRAALARPLARRYARLAWVYTPAALALILGSLVEAVSGSASPVLVGLTWVTSALVGAAHLTAVMAIRRHQDTFYDAPCGTAVATRLEIARSRDMYPEAKVPEGPGPLRDLAATLWTAFRAPPWLTLGLACLLSIVFLGEVLFPWSPATATGLSLDTLVAWGGMDRELVFLVGQPYRLLAAIFLHGSLAHLVVNVAALLVAGFLLEDGIGPVLFGAIFLLGGLGGSLTSVAVNPSEMVAVGASGAILALFAAALPLGTLVPKGNQRWWLWAWAVTLCIPAIMPVTLPGLFVVDRAAHAGGEASGLLLGTIIALAWRKGPASPPSRRTGLIGLASLAGLVAITIAIGGLRSPLQAARLVPPSEAPPDDRGWEKQGPTLLARFPDDPRARYGLALQDADAGFVADALTDLDTAITQQRRLAPGHAADFRFSAHAGIGANFFGAGALDAAIEQYTAALTERPDAMLYRQRGISEFYRGRGAEAVSDLRRALTVDPKEAYSILWLSIVAERTGLQDPIAATAREANGEQWPGPIVRFFDGQLHQDTMEAKAGLLDLVSNQNRVCEAKFYESERLITQHAFEEARPLLQLARSTCPKTFVEYRAALEELAGHGGLPPA